MKIGILTFHRAINYGAVLQCYALYKTLAGMGHDVEIIDYRPLSIEKYRMGFRLADFRGCKGLAYKIRYLASSVVLYGSKKKTSAVFDTFLFNHMTFSHEVKNPNDIPSYYDLIFFGSDQIWNPEICEGLDKIYYGQFPKQARFATYAASLGRTDLIKGALADDFDKYIKAYDRISVREKKLQNFLVEKFCIKCDIVCDPSLFISRNECEALSVKPKDKNYIMLFSLERNPQAERFANNIARQTKKKVIRVGANENPFHKRTCEVRSKLSPAEFLGYIRYAYCIVTDSFHATSFSIIMYKDFYTLKKQTNNDRSRTILETTGLENRIANASDNIVFSHIDYRNVDERLNSYREQSVKYIEECLGMIC